MAVLILAKQGKLEVDDPIGTYIEGTPKTWEKVTIHHLLTHTSGIFNYTADSKFPEMPAQPETVPTLIARFWDRPLDFPLGEKSRTATRATSCSVPSSRRSRGWSL